jgi:hypothetical protein
MECRANIGPSTHDVIQILLKNKAHPEQNYRTCFAILTSAKQYGKERLDSACKRAIVIGSPRRQSILSILKHGLDKEPSNKLVPSSNVKTHENIRGAMHYQNELLFSKTKS